MRKLLLLLLATFIFAQPDGCDCDGALNGPGAAELDLCDICIGGQNPCITSNQALGCDGVCFSGKEVDNCGFCNLDSELLNLGHLNNDNVINITDIILMLYIILNSSSFNTLADMDGNCTINVIDVVAIVNQIIYGPFNTHLYSDNPAQMTPVQIRTSIQNHIDHAANNGMNLLFEHQGLTYTIDQSILIPSNIKIDFNNSIIRRKAGEDPIDVFDMLINENLSGGNVNIVLKNLIIDGNRENDTPTDSSDDLSQHEDNDRFSGLKFSNVSDSKLIDITVQYTVNGEQVQNTPAGGIFFTNGQTGGISSQFPGCNNIFCKNINAYENDGTGIIIHNSRYITIDGSFTSNNTGSGIGSQEADFCNYYRITSENNGHRPQSANHGIFSNISINGKCSVAYDLTTSAAGGAGLNVGHPNEPANADFSIIKKVESFDNEKNGIMIRNSDYVQLSDLDLHSNEESNLLIKNVWKNQTLYDASNVRIKNAEFYDYHNDSVNGHLCEGFDAGKEVCGGYGLKIEGAPGYCDLNYYHQPDCESNGGTWTLRETTRMGHIIYDSEIYDNFYNGIGIMNLAGDGYTNNFIDYSIWIGEDVSLYNNGRADEFTNAEGGSPNHDASGIRIYYSKHSSIHCPFIHSIEDSNFPSWSSQDYGIHISGGGDHIINFIAYPFGCIPLLIEDSSHSSSVNGQSFSVYTNYPANWPINNVCR